MSADSITSAKKVRVGKKFQIIGMPGAVLLRTTTNDYNYIAIHIYPVFSGADLSEPKAFMSFHRKASGCKPIKWHSDTSPDRIVRIIQIEEEA